jgi:Tol biopolymer transport system component
MTKRRRCGLALLLVAALLVLVAATCAPPPSSATERIVFISDRTGNPEVWIMDRSGADQTQLTNTSDIERSPKLSPGGSEIAFERTTPPSGPRVWVMNADGTNQHQVTAAKPHPDVGFIERDRIPAWSPDGTKLAFVREGSPFVDTGILTMNVDGSDPHVLVASPQPFRIDGFAWSPDGTRFAYSFDYIGQSGSHIVVANADGSGRFELTAPPPGPPHVPFTPTFDAMPAWSPDSERIAFVGRLTVDGAAGIWVINADGSNAVQLTQDGGDAPSWSPAGDRIAFARGGSIWTMKPDGTDQEELTTGTQPHWAAPK